jgi:hypothetical protein
MRHSAETRAKIAATMRGRLFGPETRARMSAAKRLRLPPDDLAAAIRLYEEMPLILLEQRMGYGRRLLARVLRENGVTLRPAGFQARGMSAEQQIKIGQMLAGGHKPDAIAALLGLPLAEVEAVARRHQPARAARR